MDDLLSLESYISFEVKYWEYEVSMEYDEDKYRKKRELYSKKLLLFGFAEHITWFNKKKRISELIVTLNNDYYEFVESDSGERLFVGHITHYHRDNINSTEGIDSAEYEFEVCIKENIFSDLYQTLLEFSVNVGRRKKKVRSMFIKLPVIGFSPDDNNFHRIEPKTWDDANINIVIIGFRFSLYNPSPQ